jgi:hypothetical protein
MQRDTRVRVTFIVSSEETGGEPAMPYSYVILCDHICPIYRAIQDVSGLYLRDTGGFILQHEIYADPELQQPVESLAYDEQTMEHSITMSVKKLPPAPQPTKMLYLPRPDPIPPSRKPNCVSPYKKPDISPPSSKFVTPKKDINI